MHLARLTFIAVGHTYDSLRINTSCYIYHSIANWRIAQFKHSILY
jgi:hypothetical protein